MKKNAIFISAFVIATLLLAAGMALAAPQQGLLVDKYGAPVTGFSNVYIENGRAYPVYDPADQLWYNVFVIGTAPDGTVLCRLGASTGTDSFSSWWDDNSNSVEEAREK
jgi:hypothetical protein